MDPYFKKDGDAYIGTEWCAGPWDPTAMHGGAPSGLLCHLANEVPTKTPMQLTRLTIDLKKPVPVGPLHPQITVTREGRNIQTLDIALLADGKEVTKATALKVRVSEQPVPADMSPQHQKISTMGEPREFNSFVPFARHMQIAKSSYQRPGLPEIYSFNIARPFFADTPTQPIVHAAAVGDFCNAVGTSFDIKEWTYINADLDLHFIREPVSKWVTFVADSWIEPNGRGIAFADMADENGFFGRSVQSLVVAKREQSL